MNNFLTNKEDIIKWLDQYEIENYNLLPDDKYGYIIDVKGNVDVFRKKLTSIPVKFNLISGSFYCADNKLTTLDFSPKKLGGRFDCSNNKLTSLEFSPQQVDESFHCNFNKLTSLEFSPPTVSSSFDCSNNKLTSLEFSPQIVGGYFDCSINRLKNFEFCPQEVGDRFYCNDNPNLGELQHTEDFSVIYQEHLKYKEKKDLAEKLEKQLDNRDTSIKNSRIKI